MRLQASNDMDLGEDEVALHDANNVRQQPMVWPISELQVHPLTDHDDDASMSPSPELVQQRLSQPASPPSQRFALAHDLTAPRPSRRSFGSESAIAAQSYDGYGMHSPPASVHASYLDGHAVKMPVASGPHYGTPPPTIYSGTMSSSPPFGRASIRHAQHAPQPIGPPASVGFNPAPAGTAPAPRLAAGSPEPNDIFGYERQTVQQRRARRVVHDPAGPTTYENEGLVSNKFYSQPEEQQDVVKELIELRRGFDDLHDSEQRIEQKQQQEGWCVRKPRRTFLDDSDKSDKSSSSMMSAKVEFKHKQGDSKWRDGCYVQLRQPPSSPVFDQFSKIAPSVERVKFTPRA
jgi:hypothetical protein